MDFRNLASSTGRHLRNAFPFVKAAARNKIVWMGIGAFVLFGTFIYILLNFYLMPAYTRYDVAIEVPDVRAMPFEEASRIIRNSNLRVEMDVQQYNPNVPQNYVVDQDPVPNARVKPGRRIYLWINSGEIPTVEVPNLKNVSLRQARSQLSSRGLAVGEVHIDSIPSPYPNTITRHTPGPGTLVPHATRIEIWVSAGLGEQRVLVPDLLGLSMEEAEFAVSNARLRLVIPPDSFYGDDFELVVVAQDPAPMTSVREGTEVRVYMGEHSERHEVDVPEPGYDWDEW